VKKKKEKKKKRKKEKRKEKEKPYWFAPLFILVFAPVQTGDNLSKMAPRFHLKAENCAMTASIFFLLVSNSSSVCLNLVSWAFRASFFWRISSN